jgi:NCS1 family nucleobase:cation symporter-1
MSQPSSQHQFVENHTVDYVPPAERHGKARDLFTLWFSTNIAPLPIVTGAMVVQVFHLNLLWGLIAIALGHLLGGVVSPWPLRRDRSWAFRRWCRAVASSAATRAADRVLHRADLRRLLHFQHRPGGQVDPRHRPSVPMPSAIVIGALSATAIGVIGYRFIHILNRIGTWVMGSALLAGFIMMFAQDLPADFSAVARSTCRASSPRCRWDHLADQLLAVRVRLFALPAADIGIAKPFWATYFGATLGTILSSASVRWRCWRPEGTDAMAAVKQATGWLGPILMVLFLLNIISHNALNLYGAVLSIITSIQTFASQWTPSIKVRVVLSRWCWWVAAWSR